MRFRLGFIAGFGAGYYLGTKAGRERHEQINRWLRQLQRSDAFETASERVRDAVEDLRQVAPELRVADGGASYPSSR